jgi:enoyl-CoA hydratase/carnithine racemase
MMICYWRFRSFFTLLFSLGDHKTMSDLVLREDHDGLAVLTLNRPEALNALSPSLFVELREHVERLADQTEEIGCVILCGKGRSFSAGNDLKAIQAGESAPSRHFQAETLDAIENLPQPVIAAVHGHCYTGSLELALACDLMVTAENARLADTHGKWAMSPTWGMSQRLPRRVGLLAAKEMMFSGRVVSGSEAAAMGLANRCVPDADLMNEAVAMARSFLENSWFTLRADKMLVNQGLNYTLAEGLAFERTNSPGRGPDLEERLKTFGA